MNLLTFLERSFWNGYASSRLEILDILICLITVLALSVHTFLIYRSVTKNTFYNKNFNVSLIALAVIIAGIILTIQSNIVISLGMVGALSIVRYRTAIKDPLDLVFLFWSISTGIICGAGFSLIAIVISLVLTVAIPLFSRAAAPRGALILLVNSRNRSDEGAIMEVVQKYCPVYTVKSRNLTKDHLDMALEVFPSDQGALVCSLLDIEQVTSASLVAHDGEVTL